MLCKTCGSNDFEEENGLFYCCYCQTQSQGFTQETAETFVDKTRLMGREITKKVRKVKKVEKKGVLWTTTEAFSHILYKQMSNIFEMNPKTIDFDEYKQLTQLLWMSYLRRSGLAFTEGETKEGEVVRRLHPATRFRDQQILTKKVESLPTFKNASKELGFVNIFRLGSDGVIRTVEEMDSFDDLMCGRNEEQMDWEVLDVYNDRYRDPRTYSKSKSYELKISKESKKILKQLLKEIDLQKSFEETLDLIGDEFDPKSDVMIDSDSDEEEEEGREKEVIPTKKSKVDELDNKSDDWFEKEDTFNDYDKELMNNLTKSTKLFAKHIPLSYLKSSKHLGTDYFMDLMSLPKTLAILNLVNRLLSYDIYCFDLIRWALEGHIPYNNCMTVLPDDWFFISNDFHTFTSICVPSHKTLNALTAKMAKYIEVIGIPEPNLIQLLFRFAKDLNLPKDIVSIIHIDYDLFQHFPQRLTKNLNNCRSLTSMPFFEGWALMAIVIVLKRIFVLNDSCEKRLSVGEGVEDLFNWDQWERYSRLRLELIRGYFTPFYLQNLEDIKDEDLIMKHVLKRTEYETTNPLISKQKAKFKSFDFRDNIREEFNEKYSLLYDSLECDSSEPLKPSLYPLTNATNFALNRIKVNSSEMRQKLSISFEEQMISPWICSHGKTFHRGYEILDKNPNKWSESFKLLIDLSCIVLNCRPEKLNPILRRMEFIYFGSKSKNKNKLKE